MANNERQILIKAKLDAADSAKTIKEMKAAIKDLQNTALELGEGAEGFEQIIAKAGELNDALNDVRGTTEVLSGNIAENLTNSFAKLATAGIGAFQAIEGAQAAFGESSEDLEKTLVRLQGLMSLANGIKEVANIGQAFKDFKTVVTDVIAKVIALTTANSANATATGAAATAATAEAVAVGAQATATEGATTAQLGLNAAMLANPIIAIIAGIAALVIGISAFNDVSEEAVEKQQEFKKTLEEFQGTLADLRDEYDKIYIDIARINNGLSERGAEQLKNEIELQSKKRDLRDKYDKIYEELRKKDIDDEDEYQNELRKIREKYIQEYELLIQNSNANIGKINAEADKEELERVRELGENVRALKAENIISDIQQEKSLEDVRYKTLKEAAERNAKLADNRDSPEFQAKTNALLQQLKIEHYQKLSDIDFAYNQKLAKLDADQLKNEEEKAFAIEQIRYEAAKRQAEGDAKLTEKIEIEHETNIYNINRDFREKRLKLENEYNQKAVDQKLASEENNRRQTQKALDEFQEQESKDLERRLRKTNLTEQEKKQKRIDLLEEQRKEEINLAESTGRDVYAINKKYDDLIDDLTETRQEKLKRIADEYSQYAQAASDLISSIGTLVQQEFDQRLDALSKNNQAAEEELRRSQEQQTVDLEDSKNAQLEALYNANQAALADQSLTDEQRKQLEYEYALQKYELDKQTALTEYKNKKVAAEAAYQLELSNFKASEKLKEQAFKTDKAFRIVQTTIAGAQAVVAALALGPPQGIVLAAFAAAATIVQLAVIARQKYTPGQAPSAPAPIPVPQFSEPPKKPESSNDGGASQPSEVLLFGTGGKKNRLGSDSGEGDRTLNVNVNLDVNEVTKKQQAVASFEKDSTLGD